jgi:hypothetical protein
MPVYGTTVATEAVSELQSIRAAHLRVGETYSRYRVPVTVQISGAQDSYQNNHANGSHYTFFHSSSPPFTVEPRGIQTE